MMVGEAKMGSGGRVTVPLKVRKILKGWGKMIITRKGNDIILKKYVSNSSLHSS